MKLSLPHTVGTARIAGLAAMASPFVVASSAHSQSFIYTATGAATTWATPSSGWSATPVSSTLTTLEFGNFTSPPTYNFTTDTTTDNIAGNFVLNTLDLSGQGSGTININASGTQALAFTSAAPTINLNSGANGGILTFNVNLPLVLSHTVVITQASGVDYENYNFNEIISGNGGVTLVDDPANPDGQGISLTGANTYTGATTMDTAYDGITANVLSNGGAASSIGASSNAASNLVLDGGLFAYTGSTASTDRLFTVGVDGVVYIDNAGSGALSFTNTGALGFSGSGPRALNLYASSHATNPGFGSQTNLFAPIIGDGLGGATSLQFTSYSNWNITGQNTYTGQTFISQANVSVSSIANGGVASNIGASSNAASNLILDTGGTLIYTGAGVSTDRLFEINYYGSIQSSGTGAINFTNQGAIAFPYGGYVSTLTLGGTNTGANTLASALTGNNVIDKTGAGTWVLTGANTYSGGTKVSGGTLILGSVGADGTGTLSVSSASKVVVSVSNALGSGAITLNASTLAAGASGLTENAGSLTIAGGSVSYLDFGAANSNVSFSFADSSAYTWNGTLDILNDPTGDSVFFGGLTSGQLADIFFVNPDGMTGTFAATDNGGQLSYVGAAASAPEPGALALILSSSVPTLGLVLCRRRKSTRLRGATNQQDA